MTRTSTDTSRVPAERRTRRDSSAASSFKEAGHRPGRCAFRAEQLEIERLHGSRRAIDFVEAVPAARAQRVDRLRDTPLSHARLADEERRGPLAPRDQLDLLRQLS